jgi:hypothetical protein
VAKVLDWGAENFLDRTGLHPDNRQTGNNMPRPGGESAKLGDQYESLWTSIQMLAVLDGNAQFIEIEPYEEGQGVEFILTNKHGVREFHSAKRQRSGEGWELSDLTRPDSKTGRSVLGDLLAKWKKEPTALLFFVSATIAAELHEVWDRASRCDTPDNLAKNLGTSSELKRHFDAYLVQALDLQPQEALDFLKTLQLESATSPSLARRAEMDASRLLYRLDDSELDADGAVSALKNISLETLGQRLDSRRLVELLKQRGFARKDWSCDPHVQEICARGAEGYLRGINENLIGKTAIPRTESETAYNLLTAPNGKQSVVIAGTAGMGKSCVVAQTLSRLQGSNVPLMILRLDSIQTPGSTKALGRDLGLPASPAVVLAGLAKGKLGVLVLDQLDAVSVVSGRNPQLWETVQQLRWEVEWHPNLRVLLACRAFDLVNDNRLKRLVETDGSAHLIDLGPLTPETVKQVVAAAGLPDTFSEKQIRLLQTPFHLHLFLSGRPVAPVSFTSVQDLFSRYWEEKRRAAREHAGRPVDWEGTVGRLVDVLNELESISAPVNRLDAFADDADVLVGEHVLVRENKRYRFFHESFFDYAFARRFLGQSKCLVRFLTEECSEQSLFRRSQVRQVFAYQRSDDQSGYLKALNSFLQNPKIRLHLKKLMLDWLAQLEDPSSDEWQIVKPLIRHPELHWAAKGVLWNKVPWFDLLFRLDEWPKLLRDPDEEVSGVCARALSLADLRNARSAEIVILLEPFAGADGPWRARFNEFLRIGGFHQSREVFVFAFRLMEAGLFHEKDNNHWYALHDMVKTRPSWALEFLAGYARQFLRAAQRQGKANPFAVGTHEGPIDNEFIGMVVAADPVAFAKTFVPLFREILEWADSVPEDPEDRTSPWEDIRLGTTRDTENALISGCAEGLAKLAAENPEQCEILLAGWEHLKLCPLRFLLLKAWSANPERFGSQAAAMFSGNPSALEIDYNSSFGISLAGKHVARDLLRKVARIVGEEDFRRLESAVSRYVPSWQMTMSAKDRRKFGPQLGHTELEVWRCLPAERLSAKARSRLEELERKFPESKPLPRKQAEQLARSFRPWKPGGIPEKALPLMTDEQWIKAMRKYDSDEGGEKTGRSIGRAHDLGSTLRQQAKIDRERFARIILALPSDLHRTFFSEILHGLVDDSKEVVKGGEDGTKDIEIPVAPFLPLERITEVLLRVHDLPSQPCGRAICYVINRLDEGVVPESVIAMVEYYALHDPDPESEVWRQDAGGGNAMYGGDPYFHGINSGRGYAASTMSGLIFNHPELIERLLPAAKALAQDKSIAVRSVVLRVALAMLKSRSEEAVRLFLTASQDAEPLWNVAPFGEFLYYANGEHYGALRELQAAALGRGGAKAREIVAKQIALASFRHEEAEDDMKTFVLVDADTRAVAAKIFAHNVHYAPVRQACLVRLREMLEDPDEKVAEAAAEWLGDKQGDWEEWDRELLARHVEGRAFDAERNRGFYRLNKSETKLPSEVMRAVERSIDLFAAAQKEEPYRIRGFGHYSPALTIRLYEQEADLKLRKRCLDCIDRMVALGWNDVTSELEKGDR